MMASHATLEEKFVQLKKAERTPQTFHPKIQMVDEYLRNRKYFDKNFYSPKLVSIGPIHHDSPNLKFGENYKLTWAAKNIRSHPQFLYKKIADNIDELKGLYAEDVLASIAESLKGFGRIFNRLDENLSWLLFVDGSFLLYILMNMKLKPTEPKDDDIEVEFVLVMKDVLLLENQLPYLVLRLLWKSDYEYELIDTMKNFLKYYHWATPEKKTWSFPEYVVELPDSPEIPTHLLDLQRKIILAGNEVYKKQNTGFSEIRSKMMTHRNIEDLTAVGINLRSSGTRQPTDVDYPEGWFAAELTLPQIVVDDDTASYFPNLIAYEMCPDFKNDHGISSFLDFMHSLIDHAEDVKKLRSEGIWVNSLGSDEEGAHLFNIISTDLVYNPKTYFDVRLKIHEHHFKTCKIWLAQGYQTYFSNPWAIT